MTTFSTPDTREMRPGGQTADRQQSSGGGAPNNAPGSGNVNPPASAANPLAVPLAQAGTDAGGNAHGFGGVVNPQRPPQRSQVNEVLDVLRQLAAAVGGSEPLALDISPEASALMAEAIQERDHVAYSEEVFAGDRLRLLGLDVTVQGRSSNVESMFVREFGSRATGFNGGPLIKWITYVLGVFPAEMYFVGGKCVASWQGEFEINVETEARFKTAETLPNGTQACFYEGGATGHYRERVTIGGPEISSFQLGHAHYDVARRPYYNDPDNDEPVPRTRLELYRRTHSLRGGLDAALNGACGQKTNEDDVKLTKAQKRENRKIAAEMGKQGLTTVARLLGAPQPIVNLAGKIGQVGGAGAARLLGMGLVEVQKHNYGRSNLRKNSIIKGKMTPNATYGDGMERVRGREQIALLKSNATTGTNPIIFEFPIQPGLQRFARSLALSAMRYGEYCMEGMVFEFITETGDSPSTGVVGAVTVGYKANANIAAPTDVDALQMLDDVMDFKLSESAGYAVECDPDARLRKCLAIRTGAITSGSLMDYDMGSLVVAITPGSAPADVELMKVYITYDVVFIKKQLTTIRPGKFRSRRATIASSTPLGTTSSLLLADGNLADAYVAAAGTTLYFMNVSTGSVVRGKILWYATSATAYTAGTAAFTDATGIAVYNNEAASSYHFPLSGETCSKVCLTFTAKITAGSNKTATLALSGYTLPGASVSFVEFEMDSEGFNLVQGTSL